ncbi:MAG TPA: preprotein translocase subunit YajC [Opitutaceae bacterium]|nr:preprotein translocase subunit YajC [Opitutaceae bacterium]
MSSLLSPLFLAQTAAPAAPQSSSPFGGSWIIIAYVLLFGAMYFFMIAPQRKKQKEHEKMLSALKSGDEIVTTGGIFGVITNVKDDRFVVRIADNTKVEVGKGFVQTVLKRSDGDEKK